MDVHDMTPDQLRIRLTQLEFETKVTKTKLADADNAYLRALLKWVAAISVLGGMACILGLIWLPLAKKTLLMGAASFATLLCVSLTVQHLLPYLVWVGFGLMAAGVLAVLYHFRRYFASL